MAYATVTTKIQNPAGLKKKGVQKVAKHLSAKQIKYFGTKRQKAALKAKRNSARHAPRTKPQKNSAHSKRLAFFKPTKLFKKKKKNPVPEIISLTLGNPAHKKGKAMAARKKTKKYKKSAASRSNAGSHHKKKITHHKKRNPGALGRPVDWLKGGVGVIGGAVGARMLPELAGTSNTGGMGYALNIGATLGLGFLAHMFLKQPVITAGVIAGGVAATLVRIATDQTQYGQYLALSGARHGYGDYVVWNFSQPQRVTGANASRIDTAWRMDTAMAQDPMMAGSIDKFRG